MPLHDRDPSEPLTDDSTRETRLSEIKRQLDEGTYTIDLDLLAEKLVDEELATPDE